MEYKLPNDEFVEKALLGAMIISEEALTTCMGSLIEDDFYEKNVANRLVFNAIKRLNNTRQKVDVVTVYNELENMKKQDLIGGVDFLKDLCENAVGLTSLEHYIKIVKDCTVLRTLLVTMENIKETYNKGIDGTISDFVAHAGDDIARIVEQRRVAEFVGLSEYIERVNKDLDTYKETSDDHLIGITTGFKLLNKWSNGFQRENMIVLAARPSVGKTALALNFALTAAKSTKKTVAFFSLEMSGELLARRLLAIESGVELNKITTSYLNKDEKIRIKDASRRLASLKIFIDDTPSIKMPDLLAKAKKLQNSHNDLAMILIDYIGLITSGDKPKGDFNRQLEVSDFSRKIKELARSLKVPVIVLCQLSRNVEQDNRDPVMSDLRESGAIEQDADMIILLSPEGTKKKKAQQSEAKSEEQEEKEKASSPTVNTLVKLNLAKNRNGQTGDMLLLFQKSYSQFSDLTQEQLERIRAMQAGHIDGDLNDIKPEGK